MPSPPAVAARRVGPGVEAEQPAHVRVAAGVRGARRDHGAVQGHDRAGVEHPERPGAERLGVEARQRGDHVARRGDLAHAVQDPRAEQVEGHGRERVDGPVDVELRVGPRVAAVRNRELDQLFAMGLDDVPHRRHEGSPLFERQRAKGGSARRARVPEGGGEVQSAAPRLGQSLLRRRVDERLGRLPIRPPSRNERLQPLHPDLSCFRASIAKACR